MRFRETEKIWLASEPEPPEGVPHNTKAPPGWFRGEDIEEAASLFAHEQPYSEEDTEYDICVRDTRGTLHEFHVKLVWEQIAQVKKKWEITSTRMETIPVLPEPPQPTPVSAEDPFFESLLGDD